jgi:KipI family sensor histidine kinase inhibitor
MLPPPRLLPAGDSAIVVEYGDGIDVGINARVRQLHRALAAGDHRGIVEAVPTYRSLMVHYDPIVVSREAREELIRNTAGRLPEESREAVRTVEIPVMYGGEAGPDLTDVAAIAGMDERAVVDLHAGGDYMVFMLGFMPGFPYLGGLPAATGARRTGGRA